MTTGNRRWRPRRGNMPRERFDRDMINLVPMPKISGNKSSRPTLSFTVKDSTYKSSNNKSLGPTLSYVESPKLNLLLNLRMREF